MFGCSPATATTGPTTQVAMCSLAATATGSEPAYAARHVHVRIGGTPRGSSHVAVVRDRDLVEAFVPAVTPRNEAQVRAGCFVARPASAPPIAVRGGFKVNERRGRVSVDRRRIDHCETLPLVLT